MIARVYTFEELGESTALMEQQLPWWLHFILFAIILGLLTLASLVSQPLTEWAKEPATADSRR